MRGTVRKRGRGWEYRCTLGVQPGQSCADCGSFHWLDRRPLATCTCGGQLIDAEKRREVTKAGFPTRKAAQEALSRASVAAAEGEPVATPSRTTLNEFMQRVWLPSLPGRVKPGTVGFYRQRAETYIIPALGRVQLRNLTPEAVEAFYGGLLSEGRLRPKEDAPGLSAASVRHVHATLRRALAEAQKRGYVRRNVAAQVSPPRSQGERAEMKTWSADEVRTFLHATADDRLQPLWTLLVSNGLRRGEALGLRWDDIDFERSRLSVRRSRATAGYAVHLSTPKTARGTRVLPLAPATVAALQRQASRQAAEAAAWGEAWKDSGWVFTREDGQPFHPDAISTAFRRAQRGVPVPRLRLHDLRHTCATLALQAGVHPKVVADMLGHANIAVTLDVYSHAIPSLQADAAAQIAALFAGSDDGCGQTVDKTAVSDW